MSGRDKFGVFCSHIRQRRRGVERDPKILVDDRDIRAHRQNHFLPAGLLENLVRSFQGAPRVGSLAPRPLNIASACKLLEWCSLFGRSRSIMATLSAANRSAATKFPRQYSTRP